MKWRSEVKKLDCPHCKNPTISWLRKQFLGPARSIRCPECAAKISVSRKNSYREIVALVIVVASLAYFGAEIRNLLGIAYATTLVAVPFVLAIGIYHHFFVPLEVRARPRSERIAELFGSEGAAD
ncbi:hypothetical protein [Lentisalinibacter sediminis]|uniref:hypothetical protein n=1 Tax=Lentisalinibacter sediminis TaxID=2992237 RepID=UPI003870B97D